MKHRVLFLVPFVTMAAIACGGQIDAHGDGAPAEPQADAGPSSTASGGACADVSGTWLIGQNDCANWDFVIAQDGCNVAVKWYSPFTGTISGDELTFSEVNIPTLVCTAAVNGKSLSGGCKGTKVDGGPYDCTFEAIFQAR